MRPSRRPRVSRVRTSSRSPASHMVRTRRSMRSSSAAVSRSTPMRTASRCAFGSGSDAVKEPVSSTTSSARTTRRPLEGRIAFAASASRSRRRSHSAAEPWASRSASSRARISGSVPGKSISSRAACTYRPEPPTRIGRRPRERMSAMASRARRWYPATSAVSVTSRTSNTWWGTPRRSSGVILAVPMSMPRYSCIESALTTSPSRASARATESAVLPAAVGPTTAITGGCRVGVPPPASRRSPRAISRRSRRRSRAAARDGSTE